MANPEYKNFKFDLPPADVAWSAWYKEQDDAFQDFSTFAAPSSAQLTPQRTLSARQISGQFEDEVAKCWEEDWEDEDVDDTYDAVMGKIGRASASAAAAKQQL
jgi:hypothetical protein